MIALVPKSSEDCVPLITTGVDESRPSFPPNRIVTRPLLPKPLSDAVGWVNTTSSNPSALKSPYAALPSSTSGYNSKEVISSLDNRPVDWSSKLLKIESSVCPESYDVVAICARPLKSKSRPIAVWTLASRARICSVRSCPSTCKRTASSERVYAMLATPLSSIFSSYSSPTGPLSSRS